MISVNIISGIIIIGAVLVIALRTAAASGLLLGNGRVFGALTRNTSSNIGFSPAAKDTLTVFILALLFRAVVFVISVFAVFIMRDEPFSFEKLLDSYMQWDANNYFRIAKGGYSYYTEDGAYTTLAFLPLYPWIVRIFNAFVNNLTASGIAVSSLAYSGACAYLYNLISFDYNKQTAIRAIVFISVFPHSFFFGTMMNESVLLFTSCAALYYIRRHSWKEVGFFGALAAMSRLVGILVAVPAAVEWFEHYKIAELIVKKKFSEVLKLFFGKGLWIFLTAGGTVVYLICNYRTTGEWFKFLEYQEKIWYNTTVYWGESLSYIIKQIAETKSFSLFAMWLPELLSILFAVSMLVCGMRRTRDMYTAYLAVYIIMNMSMSRPLSIARYMTCAVPAFVILSDLTERHKWSELLITTSSAVAFGVYFTAYFCSKYVL